METNKEIMSRLKFLGKIRKGEKINVQKMQVQPHSVITSIIRTIFCQDNRSNTLNFVHQTIQQSFDLLDEYQASEVVSDKTLYLHILKDLDESKKGLKSLKETYVSDVKFCCDMDTMIQTIESRIAN
jgi:hypothetical protein